MLVTIEVLSGPQAGKRAVLRYGQKLEIGRTEWADLSIPDDGQMSGVHFALSLETGRCMLRDLGSSNGTTVQGEPVEGEVSLANGAEIVAGNTTFKVAIEGAEVETVGHAGAEGAAAGGGNGAAATDEPQTAADFCQHFELDEPAQELLEPDLEPETFLDRLLAQDMLPDAVRFWAHVLPMRERVWWACQCVRQAAADDTPTDQAALSAAETWVSEPTEENRRRAEQAALATEFNTPAGWAAASAYWSEGSLGPAEFEPAPPEPFLASKAVASAVTLAAVRGPAVEIENAYRKFLSRGKEVAQGASRWPED